MSEHADDELTAPVLTERRGHTLLVTLNRPGQRNALDIPMREAFGLAVIAARDDADILAVVVTGAGEAFCAGGDLKALTETRRSAAQNRDRIRRLHTWFRELVNLEKPVIAAVNGSAFGAGFNLALAADFVLCASDAQFCAVFGRIGLVPDLGGTFLLPRIVGLQRAKEIVFSARTIGAEEAVALGIAYSVHRREDVLASALTLAERYWSASPLAIGLAKNALNQSFHLDQQALIEFEAFAQAVAIDSAYHAEATRRFLAKEPLQFGGVPRTGQKMTEEAR